MNAITYPVATRDTVHNLFRRMVDAENEIIVALDDLYQRTPNLYSRQTNRNYVRNCITAFRKARREYSVAWIGYCAAHTDPARRVGV